jgi:hypothetical protein
MDPLMSPAVDTRSASLGPIAFAGSLTKYLFVTKVKKNTTANLVVSKTEKSAAAYVIICLSILKLSKLKPKKIMMNNSQRLLKSWNTNLIVRKLEITLLCPKTVD